MIHGPPQSPKSCLFPLLALGAASCPPFQGRTVGQRGRSKNNQQKTPFHLPKHTSLSLSTPPSD